MSVRLVYFVTPTPMANARTASAVTPRRRMPLSVGIRGSSQPVTSLSFTSAISFRFDTIM